MSKPQAKYRKDYRPSDYLIDSVELRFILDEDATIVRTRTEYYANPEVNEGGAPLALNGTDQNLHWLRLNGEELEESAYTVDDEFLTIHTVPTRFTLEIETSIKPQENTSLMGLYKSSGTFCTQCEAQGFRKITYYLDRPDVMTRFTTIIEGDKTRYPVLLSNGNRVETGELDNNRHWARWEDPFKKASYLFALVAGDLDVLKDDYTTTSGRNVDLEIYVEKGHLDSCDHAMRSLKRSMRWDEDNYGREYDLDIYMIVAVSFFNMGAMENKGLNIFNTKYVLARNDTATDQDFENVEAVIAHEYFHNWTGNRVTLRDWFQLTLKEGLTIFRDQSFTADMTHPAVKRIRDVRILRANQFPEDAGPMAHPIRPDSYIEMNNFYTSTVYNKGSEIIRMMNTMLGPEAYRKGMDLYFERHDGQAVTCEDYVRALEDANGADFAQIRSWYSQAGTPTLSGFGSYDAAQQSYTLTLRQACAPTPGQTEKAPFLMSIAVGLLDSDGNDMPLQLAGDDSAAVTTRVLRFTDTEQSFTFVNVPEKPVPSVLRNFSAPVNLNMEQSQEDLLFLFSHDSDNFNRWEAGQVLALKTIFRLVNDRQAGRPMELEDSFVDAFGAILTDRSLDKQLAAMALTLPDEQYLVERMDEVDVDGLFEAREFIYTTLARELKDDFQAVYEENRSDEPYALDRTSIGRRTLKNLALSVLSRLDDPAINSRCLEQYKAADNMTDGLAATSILAHTDGPEREQALGAFYAKWKDDALVTDKWFAIQAISRRSSCLNDVIELTSHPDFDTSNPNRFRSLVGTFAMLNHSAFHDVTGAGYRFVADHVIGLDPKNPQVAARLVRVFNRYTKYDPNRKGLMKAELERILAVDGLSKDVYEIVSKALA